MEDIPLRDRAAIALKESLEDQREAARRAEAEDRAQRAMWLRRLLSEKLGVEADPQGPEITIDGLTFTARMYRGWERNPALHLVVTCEECGEQVLTDEVYGLPQLGDMLETELRPSPFHTHDVDRPAVTQKSTTSLEDLHLALLAYLAEWHTVDHEGAGD